MDQQATLDWFGEQKTDRAPLDSLVDLREALLRAMRIRSRSCMVQTDDVITIGNSLHTSFSTVANLSDLVMVLSEIILACDRKQIFNDSELAQYQSFVTQIKESRPREGS
jgi:hypothetical protein